MHRTTTLLAALLAAIVLPAAAATTTATPKLTGPISGKPFAAPAYDLAKYGYVVEEYFVEGTAGAFEPLPGSTQGEDGKWRLQRSGNTADYKTRLFIVRPKDPARFNGTVLAHWQNVTAGYELGTPAEGELQRGYAWVGISAQKIGIHGAPGPKPAGLITWDRQRYGSLHHPGDEYSYDIFTQAARLVGKQRASAPDPLAGFTVRHVIASGGSQSASRLRTYINGIQPIDNAFDAFIPYIDFGRPSALVAQAPANVAGGTAAITQRPGVRIRDDLKVPVFVVNSETEVEGHSNVRQPDTAKYRFWEVAGASHVYVPHELIGKPDAQLRDDLKVGDLDDPNWITYQLPYEAAIHHMHLWLTQGKAPPSAPLIAVKAGKPPVIARDKRGNALGGIRLPEFAAPIAEHQGTGTTKPGGYVRGFLFGHARNFSAAELKALYPDSKSYLKVYDAALAAAVQAGYVMQPEGARERAAAAAWAQRLD